MLSPPSGTETFDTISFSASSFAPLASSAFAPLAITSLCSATECCDEHSSSSEYSPSSLSSACKYSSSSSRTSLLAPLLETSRRSSPEPWGERPSFSVEPVSYEKSRHRRYSTPAQVSYCPCVDSKRRIYVGFGSWWAMCCSQFLCLNAPHAGETVCSCCS